MSPLLYFLSIWHIAQSHQVYGCEPSSEIRQSPPCSNSRAEIFNTLVKEMCSSENEQCFKPLENLRKLLPTAPGSKVWRQLVGVAASAEGLAPTRTSSGGIAAIIGLPSPTFPDDWIVVLTFCKGEWSFCATYGGWMLLPSAEGRIETPQGPWRTCATL